MLSKGLPSLNPIKKKDAAISQKEVLHKLVFKSRNTKLGKYYDFESMLKSNRLSDAFQNNVPVHDYQKMYDRWWQHSLDGESNVAWPGVVKYFALSSGTSGCSSKYIPVTRDMQRVMSRAARRTLQGTMKYDIDDRTLLRKWLIIGGSASLSKVNNSWVGDLSGINSQKAPFWAKGFRRPSIQCARMLRWQDRVEYIARHAKRWDVGMLVGIPSWVSLTIEHVLDYHNARHIHEIWPNLSVFVTGGVNFEPYRQSFESLLGRPIHYQDTYLASEGYIAFQDGPDSSGMKLLANDGIFYEFLPFDDEHFHDNGKRKKYTRALTLSEVEEGKDYALLISTCAGAWRYMIGDTVRFTDAARGEIQITGRVSQFLSVCGEHVSVDNLDAAMARLSTTYGMPTTEYTVTAVPDDGHYRHEWYIASDGEYDPEAIAGLLDEALMQLNDDYRSERGAMLRRPVVNLVPTKLIHQWHESRGKMNGQSKIPRVIKGEKCEEWKNFVSTYERL